MAQFSSLASSLKLKGFDVESLQDEEGTPVDELIKPLLLVLNHKGYQTIASCQGHSLMQHKEKVGKGEKITKETPFSFMLEKKFGELKIKVMYDQAPWVDLKINGEQKKS